MTNTVQDLVIEPDSTCCICFVAYNSDDKVIKLPCDRRHIFHYDCLELWLENGRCICPICRETINVPAQD